MLTKNKDGMHSESPDVTEHTVSILEKPAFHSSGDLQVYGNKTREQS